MKATHLFGNQCIIFSFSVCGLFFIQSVVESIQSNPSVFLEGDKSPGAPASQHSCKVETEGGGREENEEGEISVCSMSQLGNTIANSELEGNRGVKKISVPLIFYLIEIVLRCVEYKWIPDSTWCLYYVLSLQFPVAGGAPRGWIMLYTAPMCSPPSQQWLCRIFFTPPTGSPLMLLLLFSAR